MKLSLAHVLSGFVSDLRALGLWEDVMGWFEYECNMYFHAIFCLMGWKYLGPYPNPTWLNICAMVWCDSFDLSQAWCDGQFLTIELVLSSLYQLLLISFYRIDGRKTSFKSNTLCCWGAFIDPVSRTGSSIITINELVLNFLGRNISMR